MKISNVEWQSVGWFSPLTSLKNRIALQVARKIEPPDKAVAIMTIGIPPFYAFRTNIFIYFRS
jgi:hypothetical protein